MIEVKKASLKESKTESLSKKESINALLERRNQLESEALPSETASVRFLPSAK